MFILSNFFERLIARKEELAHLSGKAAKKCVPEVHKGKGEVLIEEVTQELAHAQV